ncbi:glycosyltransferase family 2 protein [Martelella mediterranea]|uniref:dTDP-glucose pyrophosphorylase n=1 Tax=Martelella mediterranea TaxID=293089 RepID=A0A4R3NX21_9HYPH|nr:glycosyltransferase family 2 protein [Martelella mediterranea]TCT44637.1 dTDP-glucose pyrophosphorylase [Martelella mediterranea]
MLNIVVPMAGRGSRFANAGYKDPKPLIRVHGKPMIEVVVDNLRPQTPHRFIFICQNQHIADYGLEPKLRALAENVEIVGIDGITEGQACSVLEAEHFIDNDEPVMTANSDQYIDFDINDYLDFMEKGGFDGLVMTMKADDPKWSFVREENGKVVETAEKRVISNDAAVGIFNFRRGRDLVRASKAMIADDLRVNGEFYICPVYNYLIRDGLKVGHYGIGEEYNGMYGLGIPSDLDFFLSHPVSEKVR